VLIGPALPLRGGRYRHLLRIKWMKLANVLIDWMITPFDHIQQSAHLHIR
jgi:hypothetical protein